MLPDATPLLRPLSPPRKPTVYFAGKISYRDWRGDILDHARPGGVYQDDFADQLWDPRHRLDYTTFFYGGPFFVSCDHGCGHRLNAHGSNGGLGTTRNDDEIWGLHRKVWDTNCARVQLADVVFAYVNETHCFGTMVKVGLAAAQRKPVFLSFGPDLTAQQKDDLWMLTMPARVYHCRPRAAWREVCHDLRLPTLTLGRGA